MHFFRSRIGITTLLKGNRTISFSLNNVNVNLEKIVLSVLSIDTGSHFRHLIAGCTLTELKYIFRIRISALSITNSDVRGNVGII
jgi:hypothetical protein